MDTEGHWGSVQLVNTEEDRLIRAANEVEAQGSNRNGQKC